MKLEKFSFSEKKGWRMFLYGFIVCALLMVVINLFTSKAKYRTTESIPLVRGKISYKPADLNVVALYQENDNDEYESIDTIPSSGYTLNTTESYCEVKKAKDTSITMEYENGLVNFNGISKKGTKCYLYFDKEIFAKDTILENVTLATGTPDFSKTSCSSGCNEATVGLYTAEDDDGTSYYFRGDVTNNYVKFADFYWRIIRINGNGSIRMIYAGSSPTTTGTDDQLSSISAYNTSEDDNAYVGYMYGSAGASTYAATHANTNNSTIKGALDTWYGTYLNKTGVAEYIDGNAGFCNDRQSSDSASGTYGITYGYGTNWAFYIAYNRLHTNKTPSLKCTNKSADLFTTGGSSQGNRKLSSPVGLITADEVAYAGGVHSTNNTSYYLYTGDRYWTMSPYAIYIDNSAVVFYMMENGLLNATSVGTTFGVRPVINLRADTQFTGVGSATEPFTVVGAS